MSVELVFDAPLAVATWVASKTDMPVDWVSCGAFQGVGMARRGKLCGGLIFHNMQANRGDVWLSAAGDGAFVDRGVIDFIYWNAFKNLACAHLSCRTAATNNRAIRILERLGFKKEGVQRKAWDGETDAILLGLTPEDAYSCALEDI